MITWGIYLASVAVTNILILAQTATSAAPQELGGWLAIVNIGLAGVGLLAFVRGWIVPGIIHNQALEREKMKDEEIIRLRTTLSETVIPELERSKQIQEKMLDLTAQFLQHIKPE